MATIDVLSLLIGHRAAQNAVSIGIVDNPVDARVEDGETASFTVRALGENLSYQWQYSADGGETWAESAEETATAATLSFTMDEDYDEYKFRCVVSGDGGSVTSAAATLDFYVTLAITTQPVDFVGAVGDTASFLVVAEGEGLSYQWQWLSNGEWKDQSYASFKVANLRVLMTVARVGYSYRCRVTDEKGNSVTSDAVTMTAAE